MLARLLRLFPALPEGPQIKKALNENLTAKNIAIEAAYYNRPDTKAFERTYGWAWTLKLAEELLLSSTAEAKAWSANLKPLADTLAARYLDFLPKPGLPIRHRRTPTRIRSRVCARLCERGERSEAERAADRAQ